jgi:hypothetical protein
MKKVLLSTCLCAVALISCAQNKPKINQPLADSLSKWVITDQVAAKIKPASGPLSNLDPQQFEQYKDSIFNTHEILLDKIFMQYGYPGYDLVGKQGSNNYWLMVQHCDKHPDFQLKILNAMKPKVEKSNADGKNYAYLLDRVNLNTGKKQIYGTQVTYNTRICQAYPKPLADSLTVNQRRKEVGLESIEEYLNMMSDSHFLMNKNNYEKRGIYQPKLYPLKDN